jgi:putative transposase
MPDGALLAAIRAVLAASPFHGEGHRKVWARLRAAGTRTALRRVLRLKRANGSLAPTRVGAARGPRAHDGTIIPEAVDTMWGTDLTTTWTEEGPAAVFIAVDHASAACVGIHAAARATRFEALEPIHQGRAPPLRRDGPGQRLRPGGASRSRLAIHVGSLPEGTGLSRH